MTYHLDSECRVAIVDDDEAVLDSFRLMLEVMGASVRTYLSGPAMLADRNWGHCLILDQNMPGMTGLELARQLRADNHAIPILLVTAAPRPHIVREALAIGIERVLEKPPTEEEILSFVHSCAPTEGGKPPP